MLKTLFTVIAVCSDCFAASMSIGSAGIKIPFRSAAVISVTGTVFLILPAFSAELIGRYISSEICGLIASLLLITLGVMNLYKSLLCSLKQGKKQRKCGLVRIFFDEKTADSDNSKLLSAKEAFLLSAVLSADSFFVGISAGLDKTDIYAISFLSLAVGYAAVIFGAAIGKRLIATENANLQWICGVLLIILALVR